jgi:hypothetical protein
MLPDRFGHHNHGSICIRLESARSRGAFASFILLLTFILCWQATRAWIAADFAASEKPEMWRLAARWEPDNADYWSQLGSMEAWDFEPGGLNRAIVDYERAVAVNPHSDRNWLELARIYESRGKISSARAAYQMAQDNHPASSEVAWRYGSFLLRQGDLAAGYTELRRALATDPSLVTSAISECWQTSPNIKAILNFALPAKSDYYVAAINFFMEEKQFDAALEVWNRLLTLREPIKMEQPIPLMNSFIQQNLVAEAKQIWQQALDVTEWPQEREDSGSVVFNGGFEHEPANGGFDWREQSMAGVSYALDTVVFHSGKQSLRVVFDGNANFDFANLLEYMPVERRRIYHFSAYLRAEGITTDSGLRFWIYDPRNPAEVQILTPNMVGTNPWTRVSVDVATGDTTDLLVISLRRIPSWKFDNKLRGTVWVDDVSLVPVGKKPKGNL